MDTPDKLNVREEMDKERDELLELLADRLLNEMKTVTHTCEEMKVRSLPTMLKAWSLASAYSLEQQLAQISESAAVLMMQLQANGSKRIMTPVMVIGMDEYLATGDEDLIEKQLTHIADAVRVGARAYRVRHLAQQSPPADGSADGPGLDGKAD